MRSKLKQIIQNGENLTTEFKSSKSKLNKDIYETVCAFLNRDGGDILLGVSDDGIIIGVDEDKIEALRQDFLTAINNPQKLNPPCYLSADIIEIDDKKILHIYVPPGSSVYSLNGKIFDRNGDGDFNIMGRHSQRADIYHRKEKSYSENEILPYASLDDLRIDLLKKVRIRAKNENSGTHPWMDMDDIFTTTISLLELTEQVPSKYRASSTQTRVKTRAKTRVKIIEKIKLNPNITNQALASELELILKGIEWQMKKLKEDKIIERVGSIRSGYWEVADESNHKYKIGDTVSEI